ncbi:MAG: alpha/beta hydrolase [Candidatus Acidiferrales bacterium]
MRLHRIVAAKRVDVLGFLAGLICKRRIGIAVLLFTAVTLNAAAQAPPAPDFEKNLGISTLPLWAGAASAEGGQHSESSTLTIFVPQRGTENGTAVIIAPGGAYVGWAGNLEGRQVADWFAARGITAFVLKYRLGPDNPYPLPLRDAQRAVRLVRSLCKTYRLSPERIGLMGFSAGGHLAAIEATTADDGKTDSSDSIERVSDRPNFLILAYAWLNAMEPNDRGLITYCSVLRTMPPSDCREWQEKYTPVLHVTSKMPSTFLYATSDDALVPVQSSVDFYSALIKAGVTAEMHLFRHGAHGSGLGKGDPALDKWPALLESWLRSQGWLTPDPAVVGPTEHK